LMFRNLKVSKSQMSGKNNISSRRDFRGILICSLPISCPYGTAPLGQCRLVNRKCQKKITAEGRKVYAELRKEGHRIRALWLSAPPQRTLALNTFLIQNP
jgi:hypothetical protein